MEPRSVRLIGLAMLYAIALQDTFGLILGLAAFYLTRKKAALVDARILLASASCSPSWA